MKWLLYVFLFALLIKFWYITIPLCIILYFIGNKLEDKEQKNISYSNEQAAICKEPVEYTDDVAPTECNSFFGHWNNDVHYNRYQIERFNRAKSEYLSIKNLDKHKQTAKIVSSKDFTTIYDVSLDSCTCNDFNNRYKPCKHIYKLALELGYISNETDFSGIPQDIHDKYRNLSYSSQIEFQSIISDYKSGKRKFYKKKTDNLLEILTSGLIVEYVNYNIIIDKLYTKNDIIAALVRSKVENVPKPSVAKSKLIEWIIENDKTTLNRLIKKHIVFEISPDIVPYIENFYFMYCYDF